MSKHPVEVILTGHIGRLYVLEYLKVFGSTHFLMFFSPVVLATHASDIVSSFWLTLWSDGQSEQSRAGKFTAQIYLLAYTGLGLIKSCLLPSLLCCSSTEPPGQVEPSTPR